jgi:DJ-1 family protein
VICSLENELVKCSRNVILKADVLLQNLKHPKDFDILVLPGGLKGATTMQESDIVLDLVQSYHSSNKWLAVICAAPKVLLQAKVGFGKKITSHPSISNALKAHYEYQQDRVVVDGNLITSRGPGTAMEFALQIVQSVLGAEAKAKVQAPMIC